MIRSFDAFRYCRNNKLDILTLCICLDVYFSLSVFFVGFVSIVFRSSLQLYSSCVHSFGFTCCFSTERRKPP